MSDFRTYTTISDDGTSLKLYRWNEKGKHNIFLLHGYAGHAHRVSSFVHNLVQKDYRVTALDLRGHGQSGGCRGNIDLWIRYTEDTLAAVATIRAPFWSIATGSSGLSMLRTMEESIAPQMRGVVLVNPLLSLFSPLSKLQDISMRILSRSPKTIKVPNPFRWDQLAFAEDVVHSYLHDPLCLQKTAIPFVRQLICAQSNVFSYAQLHAYPLLMLLSENDSIANTKTSQNFFSQYGAPRSQKIYTRSGHALLEDQEREQVCQDIHDWIQSQA